MINNRGRLLGKLFYHAFNLVIWGLSTWLILKWYDWKLLLILILFVWANNMMVQVKIKTT